MYTSSIKKLVTLKKYTIVQIPLCKFTAYAATLMSGLPLSLGDIVDNVSEWRGKWSGCEDEGYQTC